MKLLNLYRREARIAERTCLTGWQGEHNRSRASKGNNELRKTVTECKAYPLNYTHRMKILSETISHSILVLNTSHTKTVYLIVVVKVETITIVLQAMVNCAFPSILRRTPKVSGVA